MEYGLIGEKLSHSFSKIIHNKLMGYDYTLKEIEPCKLDEFMKKADFKAINVTIPYKEDVIPYLYEISETAKKIGAVNTVVNKNGKLYGYNTDFSGLKALIERSGIKFKDKKVLILGSGGTSKTALAVAEAMCAKTVLRLSRSGGEGLITYDDAVKYHSDADIIINTTPCGMYPDIGKSAIDINLFPKLCGVVDAVYNPLKTKLVCDAKAKGITAVGGLYMLVSQAVFAAELFTNSKIDQKKTEEIFKQLFDSKRNIVLVGMPSCGKTTVGKRLATEFSKEFIDSDLEIVEKTGKSIPEIFKAEGEKGFREIESRVIAELSLKQNCVIATGGGAVLNPRNVELLRGNGEIFFIDRPLEKLITTDDRPLSSDRKALEQRFRERYGIYKACADITIDGSGSVEENVSLIKRYYSENSCY